MVPSFATLEFGLRWRRPVAHLVMRTEYSLNGCTAYCHDVHTGIDQWSDCQDLPLPVSRTSLEWLSAYSVTMALVDFPYEHDACIATEREWTSMIRSSSRNIPATNQSIYNVPSNISTAKLATSPKLTPACRYPWRAPRVMVPLRWIGWFEIYFWHSLKLGRMHFLRDRCRNNRSI